MDLFDIVISGKISKEGGGDITVEPLSVTQNGTYTADTGKAYSPVSVDVPQPSGSINITSTAQTDVSAYATAQVVDADLVASNIKKDVDILGITGTYEGGGGGADPSLYEENAITDMVIPSGITSIRQRFYYAQTSLETLKVSDSVQTIGEQAFRNCTSLTDVEIGTGLTRLENSAFNGCSNLTSVTFKSTTPPANYGNNVFTNSMAKLHVYVPAESVSAYKTKMSDVATKIEAIPE